MASMTNASALTMLNTAVDAVDTDSIQSFPLMILYSGTPPTNVDTALSGNTVLSQHDLSNPAFGNSSDAGPGATVAANAIADDTAADATGQATFSRFFDRAATPLAHLQLSVSKTGSGGEVQLNTDMLEEDVIVEITAINITLTES